MELQDGWGFETLDSAFKTSWFQAFKLPKFACVKGKSEVLIHLFSQ